jgi:ADP-glucose pyrophosphorylase
MVGRRVLGIVLAGGAGRRLGPLTADRAKSAITFGGFYRLVGIYVFDTDVLVEALLKDAVHDGSLHSMGGDIITMLTRERAAHMYDFGQNKVPGTGEGDPGYWRDLSTLDAYFDAHMDLCAEHPAFSLYNDQWPILTRVPSEPPAKFVNAEGDRTDRRLTASSATASSSPAGWCATRSCHPESG